MKSTNKHTDQNLHSIQHLIGSINLNECLQGNTQVEKARS